MTTQKQL